MARSRPAPRGKRTVYTEAGVWQEGAAIHVTVLDSSNGHFSYRAGDKEYATYQLSSSPRGALAAGSEEVLTSMRRQRSPFGGIDGT